MTVIFFLISLFTSTDHSESIMIEEPVDPPSVEVIFFDVPDYSACDQEHLEHILWLGDLAREGGFPDEELVTAAAVGLAESNGRKGAVNINRNGSRDSGIWQINSVHGYDDLHDPLVNARAAFEVWELQGWTAWYAHTPRGGEYGSGRWFQHWLPIVECILEPEYRTTYTYLLTR